jgi:hypothetical protein
MLIIDWTAAVSAMGSRRAVVSATWITSVLSSLRLVGDGFRRKVRLTFSRNSRNCLTLMGVSTS